MSSVTLHVVGWLIEISDPGNVIFSRDTDHVSGVRYDDGSVPDDVTRVTFKNRWNDDHVVFTSKLEI